MGDPTLAWGVFVRGLALVYVVAFWWIAREAVALSGRRGVTPLRDVLARARTDFGVRAFFHFPTLFWIANSDRALRGLAHVGALAALLSIVGGPYSTALLGVAWIIYLSYDVALDLRYPWECLLLEAGLLALLLPPAAVLPSLSLSGPPPAAVSIAFAWLLFRVVFGFGKLKFFGPGKLHGAYLKGFLIDQPIPARAALLLQRAPLFVFRLGLVALFVVEVVAPFALLLGPSEVRAIAALAVASLMLAIWVTGNFGYFNALVMLLCVPVVLGGPAGSIAGAVSDVSVDAASVLALAHVALGALQLPFNSWVTQSWMHWPWFVREAPLPVRVVSRLFRALIPFRVAHAYGVFTPESGPPVRWVPVIEGSDDGERWTPYQYRYVPTLETSPAVTVAPGMPRLDHFTIYEGYGLRMSGLYASVFATGNPYEQARVPFLERLVERLLEGSPEVESLFGVVPFTTPPKSIRVRLFSFEPASSRGEAKWAKRFVHTHLSARTRNDALFDTWLPAPEEIHFDELVWRERMGARRAPLSDRAETLVRTLELTLDEPALRRDAAKVAASGARWAEVACVANGESFDAALVALGRATRGDGDPGARGLALYAAFHPDEARLLCRTARLMEVTLRGAAREPPPIAPGFLRWLPRLGALYRDSAEEAHPSYVLRPDGEWARAPHGGILCGWTVVAPQ